jgi:hypothetical protein
VSIAPTVPGQSDPHHTRHHFKFALVRERWIIKFCVHQVYDMHCANFPRHLGRQIIRCLIAHPDGADTIELAHWAYGEVLPRYARQKVRRHCLSFGIPRVGKRSRRFIWALPKATVIED